jgi:hypothetical protein
LANARFAIILQISACNMAARRAYRRMLLRLTRSMRIRVGRFVALAYLFCVLAPAASLAWGQDPASCLGDDVLLANIVPAHHQMQTSHEIQTSHVHGDSSHQQDSSHHHAGVHANHQTAAQDAPAPHHHGGKGTPGPCCAMMCVSALPADLPSVAKPLQPVSACSPEIVASLHSAAPPLHYRPPIV